MIQERKNVILNGVNDALNNAISPTLKILDTLGVSGCYVTAHISYSQPYPTEISTLILCVVSVKRVKTI